MKPLCPTCKRPLTEKLERKIHNKMSKISKKRTTFKGWPKGKPRKGGADARLETTP